MANQIQIKRSTTASIPTSLANGELAFTSNGNVLYIGSPNGSIVGIGGARFPGTLTANQALVANSTGYLDEIRTANAVITRLYANNAFGTDGQVLTSNSTGGIFWETKAPSVVGTNTQIQFNDSGSLGADADLTFDKDTNTLASANLTVVGTTASANTTSGALTVAGGLGVAGKINAGDFAVGNTTVFSTINGTAVSTGSVFATGTVNASVVSVGTNFKANATTVAIGAGVGLEANGTIGTAGQVLASNGTSVYWVTPTTADIDSVAAGDGLTGGGTSGDVTVSVLANNGIIANTTGLFVDPGTGVTVNSTGVHIGQDVSTTAGVTFGTLSVTGNSALGDSGSDIVSINAAVNTSIMPSANNTYNLGNNTIRWAEIHAANLHSITGNFDGSVQISGNLSVLGTTFTVSANNLIVDDSMIQLAANNTTSDLLDIGFFGSYSDGVGSHEHTGLFRDATLDIYRLFKGLQDSPTNVVNTSGVGYTIATLEAYLSSGGLITNSSTVAITANSTVNVAIVANTLTLSSALAGTSGGTGRATTTSQALLVGNTTNGYNELALGTAGYVLQSNGSALVYDVLDGGSF